MALTPGTLPARPAARSTGEHLRRTVALAVPVMLGRIGILLLVAVDTAMVGHVGPAELAYYALASAPQIPMLLIGIGLLTGTVVLTAQADGAGETEQCGRVWRTGLAHAAVLGVLLALLCYAGEWFLVLTGQSAPLAAGGAKVLIALGWGLPGMLLFTATTFFLEGINRPVPGMLVMLGANLLNLALNWVLVFGNLGAPAMGAEGAALATTIVRWCMFAALAGYVWLRLDHASYGLRSAHVPAARLGARMRRMGLPMGLAHGLESAAFSAMMLFAGLLGAVQVAAYAIAMNLVAMAFMCAIGFATAAAVRVGNAVGRADVHGVRVAGWMAVGCAATLLALLGLVFGAFATPLAAIYASDPRVLGVAVATLAVAAFVLLPDGIQGVLTGALRGTADVWPATGLYVLSFWGVMVPLGYQLGVSRGGGGPALMLATLAGTLVAALLLAARFHRVSRRAVARA
ncbi:MAG: MATE family efflux transporter [Gammaproteobacteria bacterium]|nr:MATE family efflux transporter [Gammaproteobacteria bacterium]